MKFTLSAFSKNEDGNNLVIALILLGIIALPLVFWLGGLADKSRENAGEEADRIFEREEVDAYDGQAQASLMPSLYEDSQNLVFKILA